MFMHLWYIADEWIRDEGCQLTKGEKEIAKEVSEKAKLLCEKLFKRLDKDYCKKVIRDLETTKLVVQRSTQVYDSINIAKRDSIDYMGMYALIFCNSQDREGCIKYKKCPMYQALADAGVPTCTLETNACPYRSESYCKKTKKWTQVVVDIPEIKLPYKHAVCKQCGSVVYFTLEDIEKYSIDLKWYTQCSHCDGELGEWK